MPLTQESAKIQVHALLQDVTRDGIAMLVAALDNSDYFQAPASTCFHDAIPGGLAIHSLKVYELFKAKVEAFNLALNNESIILVSILHDLCKVGYYKQTSEPMTDKQRKFLYDLVIKAGEDVNQYAKATTRYASALIDYYKGETNVKPVPTIEFSVDDRFPIGHGEKSLILASKYLNLTEEESCIIRWHMGTYDISTCFDYPNGNKKTLDNAIKLYPSIVAFITADFESAHLIKTGW